MSSSLSRRARRAGTIAVVATAFGAALTASASAESYISSWTNVDDAGATTGFIDVYSDAGHNLRLDLVRGGSVVATSTGFMRAYVDAVPQTGDQIVMSDTVAATSQSTTLDGNPTLDASVCGTPSTFSGNRAADGTVDLFANVFYGRYDSRNDDVTGTVTSEGTRYTGTFPKALDQKWRLNVSQTRTVSPGFSVYSSISRLIGACPPAAATPSPAPAPAPAPAVLPDTTKPGGRLAGPASLFSPTSAYRTLLTGTFTNPVVVTEPGTVEQTLYLDDGAKLPAATKAAGQKKTKATKKLTLLGRGSTVATKAGAVKVTVKLSKAGKSRVRAAKRIKLALVTTVRDLSGNTRTLPVRHFTAKRTAAKGTK